MMSMVDLATVRMYHTYWTLRCSIHIGHCAVAYFIEVFKVLYGLTQTVISVNVSSVKARYLFTY